LLLDGVPFAESKADGLYPPSMALKKEQPSDEFLSPLKPLTQHRHIFDQLIPGSGQWFINTSTFKQWLISGSTKNRVLCCLGDAGIGKTSLAYVYHHEGVKLSDKNCSCRAISALQGSQTHTASAVAFVYCNYSDMQTATDLIGALLAQLLARLPFDDPTVRSVQRSCQNAQLLDIQEKLHLISEIARSGRFTSIRFCADGVDELPHLHRLAFLKAMSSLAGLSENIHFLIFGRSNCGIKEEIEQYFQYFASRTYLMIRGDMIIDDLRLFLRYCIDHHRDEKYLDEYTRNLIYSVLGSAESQYVCCYGIVFV
jgi:hypothetical protein